MLVLSRKPGERIVIGEGSQQIVVEVIRTRGAVVTLGFVADPQIKIMREELVEPDQGRHKRGAERP